MKLTWTFYPKGETSSISLAVIYVPALDKAQLDTGGFLEVQHNTAFVNWATYKVFDAQDIKARKDAFARLTRLTGNDVFDYKLLSD